MIGLCDTHNVKVLFINKKKNSIFHFLERPGRTFAADQCERLANFVLSSETEAVGRAFAVWFYWVSIELTVSFVLNWV